MRKINIFRYFGVIVITLLLASCSKKEHFITDKTYRETVHQDFLARQELAQHREKELFDILETENLTLQEREAMEFLYAYMPLSDLADYNGEFFLNQTRYALRARDTFAWGKTIPEEIFRHFVLTYRVNNEDLDTARMFIFNTLKDRIKNMSMYDAALEVNHWCHEHVAYRPADIRTSAPLATIRTSLGRCGEESTLTVTALRACGIPARQCYTPRWAHCDDNHAWVEVWVDGKWYFLGACEPDPELDMGWFAFPSTRTMMVHTNAFGKYNGSEEINKQSHLYSCLNLMPNYAETRIVTITVNDKNGQPVPDAAVKFKLYNYSEYYPLATINTNNEGKASLTTGMGDLLVWASKENLYNYAQINVRETENLTITLDKEAGKEYVENFNMTPPMGKLNKKEVSEEKVKINTQRLQYEDSLRTAYMNTFMTEEKAKTILNENLTPEEVWNFLHKSEGNHAEIVKFMNQHKTKNSKIDFKGFLAALADKDLRDTPAEILNDHLTPIGKFSTHFAQDDNISETERIDIYNKGILPARISNELIRPWRNYLAEKMAAEVGNDATYIKVKEWILKNITINDEENYSRCPISPRGVFDLRVSDAHSRNIFFVAACRALGLPAYLDNANGQLYAFGEGNWQKVNFEESDKNNATNGTLIINLPENLGFKPEYWIHYTLARFENGDFVTYDFENDPRVAEFPVNLSLTPGYYMLSTGNRYSDGAVVSRLEFFNVKEGEIIEKTLTIRELERRDMVYATLNTNHNAILNGEVMPISQLLPTNDNIFCFIDPTREPTKHLLKDIASHKTEFENWNGKINFIVPEDKNAPDFNIDKWNLPTNRNFTIDKNRELMNSIIKEANFEFKDEYPLVLIIKNDGKITFKSEGYRIGTASLIYKTLE